MDLYFGVDYYPEHWPRSRWEIDASLMKEMGIDAVRMAEFSWSKMEPTPSVYNFEWLEQAITLLAKHNIKTILGTPTAAPPAWLVEQCPDILPVDSNGIQRSFGGRHHDCHSNAGYRRYINNIVTAMAERFGNNENVIGWQIDNELGNSHWDLCMCQSCTKGFQTWLENKYRDIESLNSAWGNYFWSQDYNHFGQIPAPKLTVAGRNPSAMLDWRRFCSDLIVDFQQYQIDIIRALCPSKFITHNFMDFLDKVNYFDLAKKLDFVSHDQYPCYFRQGNLHPSKDALSAALDLTRGTKNKTFWVMEQQAGASGWDVISRLPKPGQLAMWAVHSVAHGADAVVFFRWRTCTVGTEQYWHGILPHSGKPGRRYDELKSMIHKMRPVMAEIQGALPRSDVGIVYSYDQNYALHIQPHHPELSYKIQVLKYYAGFNSKNIPVDLISCRDDFSSFKLIVAPLQYVMTPDLAEKYKKYVRNGGHLVLTMRTGVKDVNNICMSEEDLPGTLADILGIEVTDYDCLRDGPVKIDWEGDSFVGEKWADLIECKGAELLACYDSEFYKGTVAITKNYHGKGVAYYVGTEPEEKLVNRLVEEFCSNVDIRSLGESPDGVELTHRHISGKDYIFAVNHTEKEQKLTIPEKWEPVFEDQNDRLPAFGVGIFIETVN